VRLLPKSLAGRLAVLLVLTLVVAQVVTFALFTGERISAFRMAFREDLVVRLVSLVTLLEETEAGLHERLIGATSSPQFRVRLAAQPEVDEGQSEAAPLRASLASALGKEASDVRVVVHEHGPRRFRELHGDRDDDDDGDRPDRRDPRWLVMSIHLSNGTWLNAFADRPPVPPLGKAFLASFLISAAAVAAVGALGIRRASEPMRRLAGAADRLGRGESFEPLPETGPQETRLANIAFNRMRERLERFVRDRTSMLAAIAHDLRTPITSLRLRAEFIEDDDARAKILETLSEMQAMTEAVLAFTRGDSESEPTRPIDVTALAESIVEDVRASGRDARFDESPAVTLNCRPLALKRGLSNLIDNATIYGLRARVKVEADANEVRIVVDDDGPGIPATDLERVFEPFVRLESSRSRETGGAGLGLAIARSIFRAHGGDVTLQNRPEGGLRAVASLPV
jgi:signal transduction histidine kinase